MRAEQLATIATAFVLSQAPQLVAAHGDDHASTQSMGMDMEKGTSMNMNMTASAVKAGPPSYFSAGSNSAWMVAHVGILVLAWVFILPLGVMFSIARSRLALPIQFLFLVLNALGVLFGTIFNARTPDMYENNAHHKVGWVATWILTAQFLMGLLFAYAGRGRKASGTAAERAAFLPINSVPMDQANQALFDEDNHRWSGDSGQGTEPPSPTDEHPILTSELRRDLYERLSKPEPEDDSASEEADFHGQHHFHNTAVDKFLKKMVPKLSSRLVRFLEVMHVIINRTSLLLGFVAITTGGVTYAGIMRGNSVFNGLAHFIKGGIFFWYGLLTLGRWIGCFADFGWAWNVKPSRAEVGEWKARIPSGEFTESFVIFLYGSINVFLEHLGAWGGAWHPEDFEHVAIAILFFGGGLCGMLVESTSIREMLHTSVYAIATSPKPAETEKDLEKRLQPKVYQAPMNPIPGLVIMLVGIMMSSHHQDSMVSSMIHAQWGSLLVGFSLARAVTYILLYLKPPTSIFPGRPPSELIASFCLISGGLVFITSTRDIVQGMEYYNLDAMFAFTVVMGFAAFLMAWEVAVLAAKGWAERRNLPTLKPVAFQA